MNKNMEEENNNAPSLQTLAQAAKASYNMTSNGSREKRVNGVQNDAPEGYSVLTEPMYTNKMMSTFKYENPDDITHYIVSHRGSDFFSGKQAKKDLISDWNILIGREDDDDHIKRRTVKTKKIVQSLKDKGKIYMVGHSLGSNSVYASALNHDTVLKNVSQFDLINPGTSPFVEDKTKKLSKEVQKTLKNKVRIHHIDGDIISKHSKRHYIGTHRKYKSEKNPSVSQRAYNIIRPFLGGPFALIMDTKNLIMDYLSKHSIENFT